MYKNLSACTYFTNPAFLCVSTTCSSSSLIQLLLALSRSPGMLHRNEIVLSVLGQLQEATESSGLDALTKVALEVNQALAPFLLPTNPCHNFPEWAGVDDRAHGLYPRDAPGDLLPLNCKGEGNMLFDAVSTLLVGNTELSLELQVSNAGL